MKLGIKTVIGVGVFLIILLNSVYILDQRKVSIVTQFGEPISQPSDPGLHFKLPFIQHVLFFDKRIHNLKSDTSEVIALDQKTMRVDAFAKYRIIDALKFYRSAKTEYNFKNRLASILDSSLRQVLGGVPFKTLLTPERIELMSDIRNIVTKQAESFGVEVLDVRIMRADLPDKSREAVYNRMITERQKEAKEIRARGAEQAQVIRAEANKNKQAILGTAEEQSSIIRGEADSEAIKVLGKAVNKDPEFYSFYRSMEIYEDTLASDDTSFVLSLKSELMKYLNKPPSLTTRK